MSQNDDIDPYYQSGVAGVEHRDIDAAGNAHPFGDEPKEFEADLRPLIREVADDLYESWEATVREYLANAETACLKVERHVEDPESSPFARMTVDESYEPAIQVTWDRSEQKLKIQDNGIGMAAVEVDQVFRHIGRSAARDLGAMSGAFGMGALSFTKFIGNEKTMVMISNSRLNGDNAAYLVTLAGIEPIRGSLGEEEYGTLFSLDQRKKDMDIRPVIEKYAEWMRIPVLYRELDERGEEVFNEDWGGKRLYDEYSAGVYCDSFCVPGCFEAYMCEDATEKTLLLSMEIDRNANGSHSSPYDFDIRLLDESGKVVRSSNGNEGLIPVPRIEYDQMLLNERDDCITRELLSNQDVTAQVGRIDGEQVYQVSEELLNSGQPLPRAKYVTSSDDVDEFGPEKVIIGPHKGRIVVSESEWSELDPGRAEQFVPEEELEEYDIESDEGDLCLPEPTTNRSKLKSNETFWKYIGQHFNERYDEAIDEWRKKLSQADDTLAALEEMEERTVADIQRD